VIYFQTKPKTHVPGEGTSRFFAAPDDALQNKIEQAIVKRMPDAWYIDFLDTFPAGVAITVLPSTEVC
jgi:hypothetical protein